MTDDLADIRAKFRALLGPRLASLAAALDDGSDDALRGVGRELHTLKGDAALVGYGRLSEGVHEAEELLAGDRTAKGRARLRAWIEGLPRLLEKEASPAHWVMLDAHRLDALTDRLFELAADFRGLARVAAGGGRALLEEIDRRGAQLEEVLIAAWSLRMTPVETAMNRLARHAQELAAAAGKRLRVEVRAHGVELERSILDQLWDPLVQLVRNAVAHGIEPPAERGAKPAEATLSLAVEPVPPHVEVSVADDGHGIDVAEVRRVAAERGLAPHDDADALELLFEHGFSTSGAVTDLAGRGIGLDVVRARVEALGGSVSIASTPGQGTRFGLLVPAAVGRERFLVLDSGGMLVGLPSRRVLQVVRAVGAIEVAGGQVLSVRGEKVPLRSLSRALGQRPLDERIALLVEERGRRFAVTIERLEGEHELVRRPVGKLVSRGGLTDASAVLADGRLVLLLRVAALVRRRAAALGPARPAAPRPRRRRALVVDDSAVTRDLAGQILAGLGLDVRVAVDGEEALRRLEEGDADLIVADVEMPKLDGFGLLREVRARWRHLPVIMLTTRGSAEDRRRAAVLGADAYVTKSDFRESVLVDTVRRLLGLGT